MPSDDIETSNTSSRPHKDSSSSSKIRLKRTPQEEEERQWRKARRAARKAKESLPSSSRFHTSSTRARDRTYQRSMRSRSRSESPMRNSREHNRDDDEEDWSEKPQPLRDDDVPYLFAPHQTLADLRRELEEARFKEKLFDAMDEDQRLDQIEYSLNAHIPSRYAHSTTNSQPSSSGAGVDPSQMNDEEYAEWIRKGMWERSHKSEVDAEKQRERDREHRRERDRRARDEIDKEEKEREGKRRRLREEKEKRRKQDAYREYKNRWDQLTRASAAVASSASTTSSSSSYSLVPFSSLPWPTFSPPLHADDLTKDSIASFLLSSEHIDARDKTRKQRTREALLAYHPDRYVGRYLMAIEPDERDRVRELVVRITTLLNALAEDEAKKL